jgi:DNA repair protein RadC
VLAASVEDLMTVKAEDTRGRTKGIGAETALDIAALHEVARRVAREEAANRPVISSWTALLSYVRLSLQHEPREQFRVLYNTYITPILNPVIKGFQCHGCHSLHSLQHC